MSLISNTHKQDVLMHSLSKFYTNPNHSKYLVSVIEDKSISLRIIDWFVTNYSKKHNIVYDINTLETNKNSKNLFNVYISYKLQLKGYSKKQFDPFCRRERITFFYEKDKSIITTVGQLNFFKWAIGNKVLEYITQYLNIIETDMNTLFKETYGNKVTNCRKKRHEISVSATKTLSKQNVKITVSFD